MTDRELLELAAKAAGIETEWLDDELMVHVDTGQMWAPLDDDGDALRLAVKLNLAISIEEGQSWAHHDQVMCGSAVQHDGKHPYAATRRAIVRAAAEVGKDMK